ncbi:MAG: hypothetical protein AAB478_00585 [Patescibacteria group bacterium]
MNWSCAADAFDSTGKKIGVIPQLKCIGPFLQVIIHWAFYFVGIVALALILYAAIRLIVSRGDTKQVQEARQILTYALIGLIIVLTSIVLFYFITNIIGIKCIQNFGFDTCPAPTS